MFVKTVHTKPDLTIHLLNAIQQSLTENDQFKNNSEEDFITLEIIHVERKIS